MARPAPRVPSLRQQQVDRAVAEALWELRTKGTKVPLRVGHAQGRNGCVVVWEGPGGTRALRGYSDVPYEAAIGFTPRHAARVLRCVDSDELDVRDDPTLHAEALSRLHEPHARHDVTATFGRAAELTYRELAVRDGSTLVFCDAAVPPAAGGVGWAWRASTSRAAAGAFPGQSSFAGEMRAVTEAARSLSDCERVVICSDSLSVAKYVHEGKVHLGGHVLGLVPIAGHGGALALQRVDRLARWAARRAVGTTLTIPADELPSRLAGREPWAALEWFPGEPADALAGAGPATEVG